MYKKSQFFYTLPMSNICTQRTFHGGGDLSHMIVHQQKGELHTSDCGDDKSTQKFQPHFMNSKVFWRLVCTQNDSSSRVYSYNYLTYYNVFFMNCLTYTTISTTLL